MEWIRQPLVETLNQAADSRVNSGLQQSGKSFPCTVVSRNGYVVTVNFEIQSPVITLRQITVPIAMWNYALMPVQPGDKGYVVPSDAYLGAMTGLGNAGTARLGQLANLSSLVFVPLSNTAWSTPDENAVVLTGSGASGVILRDGYHQVVLTLTTTGIVLSMNGQNLTVNLAGGGMAVNNGTITVTGGDVIADGVSLKTHLTTEVQSGGALSGPPQPG
jgi:hypothetical protein